MLQDQSSVAAELETAVYTDKAMHSKTERADRTLAGLGYKLLTSEPWPQLHLAAQHSQGACYNHRLAEASHFLCPAKPTGLQG